MNYDHDHPELCPLPDCTMLGPDPEPPGGRFEVLSQPAPVRPRLHLVIRASRPARRAAKHHDRPAGLDRRALAHRG
jgi:hypothetical protein